MGIAFITFFGDFSKKELEKELSKVKTQRAAATDAVEIARLDRDIADLEKALESK